MFTVEERDRVREQLLARRSPRHSADSSCTAAASTAASRAAPQSRSFHLDLLVALHHEPAHNDRADAAAIEAALDLAFTQIDGASILLSARARC